MIKDVSKILVVDLELSCWETEVPPPGETSEIIQIGWAWLLVGPLQVVDKASIMVKPQKSKISEFCTNLTGITPKMAKGGIPFDQACKFLMRKLGGRQRSWAAWGDDREALLKQCAESGAELPFSEAYMNAQLMTTLMLGSDKPRLALEQAMISFGISPVGEIHRADNDAYDTAMVLSRVMRSFRVGAGPMGTASPVQSAVEQPK